MPSKNFICFILFLTAFRNGQSQTLSSLSHLQNKISFTNDAEIKQATETIMKEVNKIKSLTAAQSSAEKENWKQAAEYAQDNTTVLSQYLLTISKYPNLISFDKDSHDNNIKNIYYVLLASQSQKELKNYLGAIAVNDKRDVQLYIDGINSVLKTLGKPTVSVFASGDIAGSISNQGTHGTPNQSTVGTGSVGVRYVAVRNIISSKVFVASSQDTLKNDFGQSLLSPAKGKALGSALIEWYHRTSWKTLGKPWIHVYGSVATSLWDIDSTNANPLTRSASVFGTGVLLNWPAFSGKIANTDAGLNLEVGCSLRYFGGDIRNLLKSGNDSASFIKAFPTRKNTFIGPEFGMSINIGDVTAAIQAYLYSGKKNEQINGLTHLQFSFGISINASVISGLLD